LRRGTACPSPPSTARTASPAVSGSLATPPTARTTPLLLLSSRVSLNPAPSATASTSTTIKSPRTASATTSATLSTPSRRIPSAIPTARTATSSVSTTAVIRSKRASMTPRACFPPPQSWVVTLLSFTTVMTSLSAAPISMLLKRTMASVC
ncbi:hypothetical protein EV182_007887, partial [Spiromyces aspiralis]